MIYWKLLNLLFYYLLRQGGNLYEFVPHDTLMFPPAGRVGPLPIISEGPSSSQDSKVYPIPFRFP